MKSTFSFDEAVVNRLNELAAKKGVSKTEILRRAITLYDYLEETRDPQTSNIRMVTPQGEVDLVLP